MSLTVDWRSKSTWRMIAIATMLTMITHFPAAFLNTCINTAVNSVEHYFNASFVERGRPLSFTELSLLKSAMNSEWYAGMIPGALISPFICDRYGRKVAYQFAAIGMTVAIAAQTAAVHSIYPELFLIARLGTAFFSPISDTALVMYLQEICPSVLRGTLTSLYSTGYCLMSVVGMSIGQENILGYSLQKLFFFPTTAGIIAVIITCFIPETPKYLVSNDKEEHTIIRSVRFFQGRSDNEAQYFKEIHSEIAADRKEGETEEGIMVILRTSPLRKAMLLAILFIALDFPFYALLQSSTHYFTALGVTDATAQTASSYLMVALTLACTGGTIIVDRLPRKTLLFSCGLLMLTSFCVYITAAYLSLPHTAIAAVYGIDLFYGLGVTSVNWTILGELVSTIHRSALFSLVNGITNGLIVPTNFLSLTLFDMLGPICFVPLFIIPGIITYIILFFHLPETRGKEPSVIYEELKYGPNKVAPAKPCADEIEI